MAYMKRLLLSLLILLFPFIYMEGSVLVYDSPAEKTYADTSCFRIIKGEHGENLYEVAYITVYTAIQSNGSKKVVYIQQYNDSWSQYRIRHRQYYDEFGKLISYSDAYGKWYPIRQGTLGATLRDKVKIYF